MTTKETKINELVKEAHKNAVDHGWWVNPKSFGELMALVHSEVSEALEEYRNGKKPNETYYSKTLKFNCPTNLPEKSETHIKTYQYKSDIGTFDLKPEGVPSELADIVIRVFDLCGYYGIDLEAAIKEKMKYNESRPYKHGGKKI